MSQPSGRGPAHVPILTEIVQVDVPVPVPQPTDAAAPRAAEPSPGADDAAAPEGSRTVRLSGGTSPFDETQLTQNVLADVQRQIDLMLEYRLREAIAPALARASDALIRDLRAELAEALREIVARAVAQELARHRQR